MSSENPLVKGLGLLSCLFAQQRFGVELLCPVPQSFSWQHFCANQI
jgi:hypothetical protein